MAPTSLHHQSRLELLSSRCLYRLQSLLLANRVPGKTLTANYTLKHVIRVTAAGAERFEREVAQIVYRLSFPNVTLEDNPFIYLTQLSFVLDQPPLARPILLMAAERFTSITSLRLCFRKAIDLSFLAFLPFHPVPVFNRVHTLEVYQDAAPTSWEPLATSLSTYRMFLRQVFPALQNLTLQQNTVAIEQVFTPFIAFSLRSLTPSIDRPLPNPG